MKVNITLNVNDNTPVECIEKAFNKMIENLNCDCSYIIGCDVLQNPIKNTEINTMLKDIESR